MAAVTYDVEQGKVESFDPMRHPRDENGRFIKLKDNVYKYGKVSVANFRAIMGPEAPPIRAYMNPGDVLYKTVIGNYFMRRVDGTYVWYGNGTKPPKVLSTMTPPEGTMVIYESKAITVKADKVEDAASKVDSLIAEHLSKTGQRIPNFLPDVYPEIDLTEPELEQIRPTETPSGEQEYAEQKPFPRYNTTINKFAPDRIVKTGWKVLDTIPLKTRDMLGVLHESGVSDAFLASLSPEAKSRGIEHCTLCGTLINYPTFIKHDTGEVIVLGPECLDVLEIDDDCKERIFNFVKLAENNTFCLTTATLKKDFLANNRHLHKTIRNLSQGPFKDMVYDYLDRNGSLSDSWINLLIDGRTHFTNSRTTVGEFVVETDTNGWTTAVSLYKNNVRMSSWIDFTGSVIESIVDSYYRLYKFREDNNGAFPYGAQASTLSAIEAKWYPIGTTFDVEFDDFVGNIYTVYLSDSYQFVSTTEGDPFEGLPGAGLDHYEVELRLNDTASPHYLSNQFTPKMRPNLLTVAPEPKTDAPDLISDDVDWNSSAYVLIHDGKPVRVGDKFYLGDNGSVWETSEIGDEFFIVLNGMRQKKITNFHPLWHRLKRVGKSEHVSSIDPESKSRGRTVVVGERYAIDNGPEWEVFDVTPDGAHMRPAKYKQKGSAKFITPDHPTWSQMRRVPSSIVSPLNNERGNTFSDAPRWKSALITKEWRFVTFSDLIKLMRGSEFTHPNMLQEYQIEVGELLWSVRNSYQNFVVTNADGEPIRRITPQGESKALKDQRKNGLVLIYDGVNAHSIPSSVKTFQFSTNEPMFGFETETGYMDVPPGSKVYKWTDDSYIVMAPNNFKYEIGQVWRNNKPTDQWESVYPLDYECLWQAPATVTLEDYSRYVNYTTGFGEGLYLTKEWWDGFISRVENHHDSDYSLIYSTPLKVLKNIGFFNTQEDARQAIFNLKNEEILSIIREVDIAEFLEELVDGPK